MSIQHERKTCWTRTGAVERDALRGASHSRTLHGLRGDSNVLPKNASSNASHLDVGFAEQRVGRLAVEAEHLAADRERSAAGHVDEQFVLCVEACAGASLVLARGKA